jgi:hypothetical protein
MRSRRAKFNTPQPETAHSAPPPSPLGGFNSEPDVAAFEAPLSFRGGASPPMRSGRPSISKSFAAPAAGSRSPSPPRPVLPPTPLPPTNSPSRDYRQHHVVVEPQIDAETFHPERVKTRLVALAEAEKIDRFQLETALEYRRWRETLGRLPVQAGRSAYSAASPARPHQCRRPRRLNCATPARRSGSGISTAPAA